ncbi:hypothetical protein [Bradyrhizobium sp.]|uniref:hypothetical protein n=1 Tax=Bradyrhizobium sp. TaxID=376 RepID=UPI003C370A1D
MHKFSPGPVVTDSIDDSSPIGCASSSLFHRAVAPVVKYWLAFAGTAVGLILLAFAAIYSPGEDHLAAIPLNGDGAWYYNYGIYSEIQDNDIFFHGIGHSIENAQQADIIFLGTSRPLLGIDWRLFEAFEQKHHLKMFNMAFAGVPSGEFALRIIQKWALKPKMWVIDVGELHNSFFSMTWTSAFGASATERVVSYGRLRAFKNVLGRNLVWRLKIPFGLLNQGRSFRSAKTGNWYLDGWPNYLSTSNPRIQTVIDSCPAPPEELEDARHYVEALGGIAVLTQTPNKDSCARRVLDIASALTTPAITVDATQFTTADGGTHLDRIGAHEYTAVLFSQLEQLPAFRKLFPAPKEEAGVSAQH